MAKIECDIWGYPTEKSVWKKIGNEPSKASFLRSPTVVFVRSILCNTKLLSVLYSKDLMILSVIVADESGDTDIARSSHGLRSAITITSACRCSQ